MRTRSSGPAKDPVTGQVFLDLPKITIPAFIHKPVPFNPFPEAAFPTLEFPVPQPSQQHERARRIVRSNRGALSTPGQSGSPSSVASGQRGAREGIRLAQGVTHGLEANVTTSGEMTTPRNKSEARTGIRLTQETTHGVRPQLEENESTSGETSIPRNQPGPIRCVATLEPGEFKNNPHIPPWIDSYEQSWGEENNHSPPPTMEKTYDVIPTWSSLTPGVQIVLMTEMADIYGIDNAPKLLELTSEEINKYVDIQEREAQAQAAEDERVNQYNNHRFQEMLAGKLDGSNSMELLDLQFSQGSIWEPATFAMKKVDLKAGTRFLCSLGFADESSHLWTYYGMEVSLGYDFRLSANDPQEVDSPKIELPANQLSNEITGQPEQQEHLKAKVKLHLQPMSTEPRNIVLERVKKPKKSRPPKKKDPLELEPFSSARKPSKLSTSILVDDVLTEDPSDIEERVSVKARVARQVPPGTDMSKAVKYTKPLRQWADLPSAQRGSKEQYIRKQMPKAAPAKHIPYVEVTGPAPNPPMTPEGMERQHGSYLQPPSENAWFASTPGGSRIVAGGDMMDEPHLDIHYPHLPVPKNIAGFANSGLAAKWAKKPKPADISKTNDTASGPVLRRHSTLDPGSNSSNDFTGIEPLAGTQLQQLGETQRPKRKTATNDLRSPFDASTPSRTNNGQKWKEGTMVRTRQLSIQEQYVADEDIPIEMLDAGEQILMTRPRVATRTTRRNSGGVTAVEGRNGKGDGTRKNSRFALTGEGRSGKEEEARGRAAKRFQIPRSVMREPEDEDE